MKFDQAIVSQFRQKSFSDFNGENKQVFLYQMVFAKGEHFDVFNDDHLIVVLVEDRALDGVLDAVLVPLREKQQRLRGSQRGYK